MADAQRSRVLDQAFIDARRADDLQGRADEDPPSVNEFVTGVLRPAKAVERVPKEDGLLGLERHVPRGLVVEKRVIESPLHFQGIAASGGKCLRNVMKRSVAEVERDPRSKGWVVVRGE